MHLGYKSCATLHLVVYWPPPPPPPPTTTSSWLTDHFYKALFSAAEQTHCTPVACGTQWAWLLLYAACFEYLSKWCTYSANWLWHARAHHTPSPSNKNSQATVPVSSRVRASGREAQPSHDGTTVSVRKEVHAGSWWLGMWTCTRRFALPPPPFPPIHFWTQDSVHKPQPFWREGRVKAELSPNPSAYLPNTLALGQTGSSLTTSDNNDDDDNNAGVNNTLMFATLRVVAGLQLRTEHTTGWMRGNQTDAVCLPIPA